MIWSGWKLKEKCHILVSHLHGYFHSKTPIFRKIRSVFTNVKRWFNASWGLKGLMETVETLVFQRQSMRVFTSNTCEQLFIPSKFKKQSPLLILTLHTCLLSFNKSIHIKHVGVFCKNSTKQIQEAVPAVYRYTCCWVMPYHLLYPRRSYKVLFHQRRLCRYVYL